MLIDVERDAFRLYAEIPNAGRRLTRTVGTFNNRADAERERGRLIKDGDSRALVISESTRGRRPLGTYTTRKEAERAEREALSAKDRGIDLAPVSLQVGTLVNRYVRERSALGLGLKTIEEYQRTADLYITPHLGSVAIQKLKPATVSVWLATLLQRGGRNNGPISARTARHAFALLNAALRWGIRMEIVGRNVCEAVTRPSVKRSTAKALTMNEVGALSDAARGSRWEPFIEIALKSGTRRGELLALTWNDVDLEIGLATIKASLSQTSAGVALKTTKSDRVRLVPLSPRTRAAFRKQRAQQAADRLRAGEGYCVDPTEPIFTNEVGQRVSPKAATNAFARLAKKARLSTTSLHRTRHTAITELIHKGADLRTVAAVAGHSNASVTLSIYSHVIEGAERAAVDLLEGRLEEAIRAGTDS